MSTTRHMNTASYSKRFTPWLLGVLLGFGALNFGQGLWIFTKAELAQWLIAKAWAESGPDHPVRPWPWADTWPAAQLQVPRLQVDLVALQGLEGNSLAFGPGMIHYRDAAGLDKGTIIAGHKDTHFRFLPQLQIDDEISLTGPSGQLNTYQVVAKEIVDSSKQTMQAPEQNDSLLLITCYPFNSLSVGGPLRYVVTAVKVEEVYAQPNKPQTGPYHYL